MKFSSKIAIQATLDELDGYQTQQVLEYIKHLLYQPRRPGDYQAFKLEAMKEIRTALMKEGALDLMDQA